MNTLDPVLQASSLMDLAPAKVARLGASRRLVVVILDVEEEALLASRILELAKPLGLHIVLIGIAPDSADERKLRRKLVTIAAFLQDGQALSRDRVVGGEHAIPAELQVVQGRDWLAKLKLALQPDDMLACYGEQVVGSRQRPLTDILAATIESPIYAFSGLRTTRASRRDLLAQAVAWLTSLASIGGCFAVQVRIVTAVQGWAQPVLLLVTLFSEAGLIWLLNSLFAQS